MKSSRKYLGLILLFCLINSCGGNSTDSGSDNGGDNGNGGGNQVVSYSLSTNVNPENSGSVNPASGTFDEGASVEVEATPNDGYAFVNWTGDISSNDNPLTFTINSNTDITANFEAVSSSYSVSFQLKDAENTMSDLAIGQNDNAMDGEDSQDFDSPPAPPGQTLHAFFKTDGRELFKDFRNSTTQSQIWNLQIRPGSGDTIMLSWNVDISYLHGSLMLKNADSSVEINMQDQSNVEIQKANADSVIIEYQLSN